MWVFHDCCPGVITHCHHHLDASRFLAQSQSRIALRPDELHTNSHDHRWRPQGNARFPTSRSFLQRTTGDPYQSATSQISNLPFAPRRFAQAAPLFYSATDEFREEDDEEEHEREIADFYALQRSRRHFGSSHLRDSLEVDGRGLADSDELQTFRNDRLSKGKGIRSSWRDEKASSSEGSNIQDELGSDVIRNRPKSPASRISSDMQGNLVDIGLDDTLRTDDFKRPHSPEFGDDEPPIQRFRGLGNLGVDSSFIATETDKQKLLDNPPPQSSTDSYPASGTNTPVEPPLHDAFWGQLFLISLASLFATAFLVYLHTKPPGDKPNWGDTVYITIHRSYFLLSAYTLVSIIVSLLWLALLRSYVRTLVYVIMVSVPVLLYSFSLYPFISSFKGTWHGASFQDKVMRFSSVVPLIIASAWVYIVIKGRRAINKAINILEFACRILSVNPELLALGLGILVCIVCWTWLWMLMFTRVFLGGHFSGSKSFIINVSSWWLGVYFVLVYVWSLGVIGGIQRAVTAATVSQWYFHRLATPAPTSRQIVQAAITHAASTLFGTICYSTILALLIRLPLLVLPNRVSSVLNLFVYSFVPTPVTTLTNPLSLSYAAIHSQPLAASARGLSQLTVLSPRAPATSLHPNIFYSQPRGNYSPISSYQLSKLILHAARFMMSLALGFGGWVTTARNLSVPGAGGTTRGSLYAYVVGLLAGVIGWSVLGAIEGVVADIVDASVICWGSEVGTYGREARYCREAEWLFGEDSNNSGPRRAIP